MSLFPHQSEKTHKATASFSAGCAFLFLLIITLGMGQTWLRYKEVAQTGATTTGKIIQLTPQDHYTAKYQFSAKGGLFTGTTGINAATAVGDTVTVYYFPDDPEHNCVDPLAHANENFVSTVVFAALTLVVPIAVLYVYRKGGKLSSK